MWRPRLDDGSRGPLFQRIAQAIADDIAGGRLPVGARLPPHRDLADELRIARGTVARAYAEAERLGLLSAAVGRGTEVVVPGGGRRPFASLLEPPHVSGDPAPASAPSSLDPDPAEALRRLADRADRKSLLRYAPPGGLARHRFAGVTWLARLDVPCSVHEVLVTSGAQHALYAIASHLAARSRALYVEALTYPGMHGIAEAVRLPLVPVSTDGEGMSARDLERAASRHGPGLVYTMPTLQNPLGTVMSDARREALAAVARARGLALVEDAANRMLLPRRPRPLRAFAPERTFVVASVSKVLAPGLRVAFLLAPEADRDAIARRLWITHWMPSPLGAELVALWTEDGTLDRTLAKKRREAARRQAIAVRVFGARRIQAHPRALHFWLFLPHAWYVEAALAEGARQALVVTPASAFWAGKGAPPAAVRVSTAGVGGTRGLERRLTALERRAR